MQINQLSDRGRRPQAGDYFVTDDGTNTRKTDFTQLAQAVIGDYAGNTINGKQQTPKAAIEENAAAIAALQDNVVVNARRYTARWNKSSAKLTRLNDAAGITTTTTNFGHFGSVNSNYNNPFDNIYPWSGIRLCNIDIDRYTALAAGDSLLDCVKAWEGDPDFSYTDESGVWRYTPEFWGKSWDDGTYRYFEVADREIGGYVHYRATIEGRWHGRNVTLTVGGTEKTVLVPSVGMPAKRITMSTLHTYAKNYGATLDNIFTVDGSLLLAIVEYANMDMQAAIGQGVASLYRESSDKIQSAASNSNIVEILSANAATVIPGAIFDIGTANGGNQVGSFIVESVASSGTITSVTLNEAVTVTTDHFWSVHGLVNKADESIGSKSGYIGTNGRANAYYRGAVMFGNLWFYILGAYRQSGTQKVWIAANEADADAADALDTAKHLDTGIVLAGSNGYVQTLGMLSRSGLLSIPPFCTAIGGSSAAPVGDYHYINTSAGNTVLICGGSANHGASDGPLSGYWNSTASYSGWVSGARPALKSP